MAETTFRPDMGALKGKTTCQRPPIVESPISSVAAGLLKQTHAIMLCMDVVHINHNPMLILISCNIKFGTVKAIENNKTVTIMSGINLILKIYK